MQVAIITGGAQGIGKVTAEMLSDSGWQVAVLDVDEEALSEISSERITTYLCDIANEQHPAGRIGTPDDIAAMVAYLLSEHAAFITGQDFVVDGGITRKMIYV